MTAATSTLYLRGLRKRDLSQLKSKAKRLGITPELYIKRLVQEDLSLDRAARATSFADMFGPGDPINEAELDAIVEKARQRHHRRTTRKGR